MFNLGPSAPFVGIATFGLVAASLVMVVLLFSRKRSSTWKNLSARHEIIVVLLLAVTFVLWGTSTGHGKPHTDGGMIGYTHGGMLHYVSASSYQQRAGAPWAHDISLRPLALLSTIALNAAAVIVALLAIQWRSGGVPN
jgi:hypothetical protein